MILQNDIGCAKWIKSKLNIGRDDMMKKMTESEQMKANGGWGAYCNVCGWSNSVPAAFKGVLRVQVATHNQIYPGHNAHIC